MKRKTIVKKTLFWTAVIAAALALTGCHTGKSDLVGAEVQQPSITQVPDEASTQIAEAAASVSHAFTDLDAVDKANMAPAAAKIYPTVAAVEIPGVSSVDWTGPIGGLVSQIAKASGYKLHIIGHPPMAQIIVSIHSLQAEPNATILRDAALQAGLRAKITTDARTKTIVLQYRS
ncbi:MAG: dotD [Gammaproteobacteria bacterium]|jgi:hypothetical protein|nr:dotD [Gammaproteobacteria bacterium]